MSEYKTANYAKYSKTKFLFAWFVYFAVKIGIPCWNRTSLCGFAGRRHAV